MGRFECCFAMEAAARRTRPPPSLPANDPVAGEHESWPEGPFWGPPRRLETTEPVWVLASRGASTAPARSAQCQGDKGVARGERIGWWS